MSRLALLPALAHDQTQGIVAWSRGQAITRQQFAQDVQRLAQRLPSCAYVLNHCVDRYAFLVGLVAAMSRQQVSLFPPSRAPQVLRQLQHDYPDIYGLTDQDEAVGDMTTLNYVAETSGPQATPIELAFPAEQLVAIAFTSGSTGRPTGHAKRYRTLIEEARLAGRTLGLDPQRGGHIVATVPPQHMYGLLTSIFMPLQYNYVLGAEWPFYPEDIRKAVAARPRAPILVTTPVHIRACLKEQTVMPDLDFVLSSTAPLSKDLAVDAERQWHTRVVEFYGSTETGAIAHRRQSQNEVWRVFEGVSMAPAQDGFCVSAPYLEASPIALGDAVEIRADNTFVLHGRNADLIKIAGKRILLSDLNHKLLSIVGVEDGTFFLPEAVAGAKEPRLMAFVVAPGMSREQLLGALRESIDPVFLPRPLRLVDALPRNDNGKLPRGNLLRLWHEVQV